MANEDTFDVSPNRIEPKGKVRGVTRISQKAKMVAFIVLGGVLLLVTVATYQGFQANKPAAQNPDGSSTQKKLTPLFPFLFFPFSLPRFSPRVGIPALSSSIVGA